MSAWVLPDHIADVLPSEARHIEELRRELLDTARGYGYELVIPPLLEHLESLLTGTGEALDLQTFKLVDQLSGRSMGLRADTTPQVARIDAHLLNRQGVARLCYCGPVLQTRPDRPHATRQDRGQADKTQLTVAEPDDTAKCLPPCARRQQRQQTFEDQHQCQSGKQYVRHRNGAL